MADTVRRNSFNQIISYTKLDGDISPYPKMELPAQKSTYSVDSFNKFIDTDIDEMLIPVEESNLTVINLNIISISNLVDTDETLVNDFNWSGEIVQLGFSYDVGSPSYYYIENEIYHKLPSSLIINLVAEKLGKPFFFKVGEDYEYSDDPDNQYRYLDYGQNQYIIYDDIGRSPNRMYERKSSGYLDSFRRGLDVILTDIIVGNNKVMDLDFIYDDSIIVDFQGESAEYFYGIEFGNDVSTRVEFKKRIDNKLRQTILRPESDLNYKFTRLVENMNPNIEFSLQLLYQNGETTNLPLDEFDSSASIGTVALGAINGNLITDTLKQIKIIVSI